MQTNARMIKKQLGMKNMSPLPCCVVRTVKIKKEDGEEEDKQESKHPDDERKVDPGTVRNTEEPQGTQLMQSYVRNGFMTGIMSEWTMSMIEDNFATPSYPSSVRA